MAGDTSRGEAPTDSHIEVSKHPPKPGVPETKPSSTMLFKVMAFILAFILTLTIAFVVSAISGQRVGNLSFTFIWMLLTIFACREIGIKAVLYYPAYILTVNRH
jgi:hypothetical protein